MADTETFTSNIVINCNFTSEFGSISILTIGRTEPESFTKKMSTDVFRSQKSVNMVLPFHTIARAYQLAEHFDAFLCDFAFNYLS